MRKKTGVSEIPPSVCSLLPPQESPIGFTNPHVGEKGEEMIITLLKEQENLGIEKGLGREPLTKRVELVGKGEGI